MLSEWPLLVVLAVAGLGVAGQNIGAALVAAMFLIIEFQRRTWIFASLAREFKLPLVGAGLILFSTSVATLLNDKLPIQSLEFLGGFAFWLLAPLFLSSSFNLSKKIKIHQIELVCVVALIVVALVSASQFFFGWKLKEGAIIAAELRGRGFYSHPLSLAYASLIWLPFCLTGVLSAPRKTLNWLALTAVFSILVTTASRTVQSVAMGVVLWNIFSATSGRMRVMLFSAVVAGTAVLAVTENPVSRKFRSTIEGVEDRQSDYADDRVAFWHVHWNMFIEKPLIGHGDNTNTAYRTPYYEKAGLAGLDKKYEAHNLYLQLLVNSGLIGLIGYLVWLSWNIQLAFKMRSTKVGQSVLQALIAFSIAGLTQNAFQDSAVRFNLTIAVAALWIFTQYVKPPPESLSTKL